MHGWHIGCGHQHEGDHDHPGIPRVRLGTIDANTMQIGNQHGFRNGRRASVLLTTASNTAVLKVNTAGSIGLLAGSPVAGQDSTLAVLNILDGGTVTFASTAPLTCGASSRRHRA